MTLEEAAELVLHNQPFIDCLNCKGLGRESVGVSGMWKICSSCKGARRQARHDYIVAYHLLGLELPDPRERPAPRG